MGSYLLAGLKELQKHPIVGEARGVGLWSAIEIVKDKNHRIPFTPEEKITQQLTLAGRDHGVIFRGMGNALEFAPPLSISRKEIEAGLRAIDLALHDVEKKLGF